MKHVLLNAKICFDNREEELRNYLWDSMLAHLFPQYRFVYSTTQFQLQNIFRFYPNQRTMYG